MFFSENPFYRLGVHSTDSPAALQERERKLSGGEPEEVEALRLLLQQETRCEAEFYWLVGWSKEEALSEASRIIAGRVYSREHWAELSPLSRMMIELNEMAAGHISLSRLLKIERDFEALSPLEAAEDIQRDRRTAGVPLIKEPWIIEMWKQDLLSEIGRAASLASSQMKIEDYGGLLHELGEKGRRGMVYFQLLSDYEKRNTERLHAASLSAKEKGKRNFAAWLLWGLLAFVLLLGWLVQ